MGSADQRTHHGTAGPPGHQDPPGGLVAAVVLWWGGRSCRGRIAGRPTRTARRGWSSTVMLVACVLVVLVAALGVTGRSLSGRWTRPTVRPGVPRSMRLPATGREPP